MEQLRRRTNQSKSNRYTRIFAGFDKYNFATSTRYFRQLFNHRRANQQAVFNIGKFARLFVYLLLSTWHFSFQTALAHVDINADPNHVIGNHHNDDGINTVPPLKLLFVGGHEFTTFRNLDVTNVITGALHNVNVSLFPYYLTGIHYGTCHQTNGIAAANIVYHQGRLFWYGSASSYYEISSNNFSLTEVVDEIDDPLGEYDPDNPGDGSDPNDGGGDTGNPTGGDGDGYNDEVYIMNEYLDVNVINFPELYDTEDVNSDSILYELESIHQFLVQNFTSNPDSDPTVDAPDLEDVDPLLEITPDLVPELFEPEEQEFSFDIMPDLSAPYQSLGDLTIAGYTLEVGSQTEQFFRDNGLRTLLTTIILISIWSFFFFTSVSIITR